MVPTVIGTALPYVHKELSKFYMQLNQQRGRRPDYAGRDQLQGQQKYDVLDIQHMKGAHTPPTEPVHEH